MCWRIAYNDIQHDVLFQLLVVQVMMCWYNKRLQSIANWVSVAGCLGYDVLEDNTTVLTDEITFQLLVVQVMMCWSGLKPLSNKDFKG